MLLKTVATVFLVAVVVDLDGTRGGQWDEVLCHLGVVGLRVGGCCAGERGAVGEGGRGAGAAGAGAVGLDDCALGEVNVVATYSAGLLAVNVGLNLVADEGDGARDLGRVEVGVGKSTLSDGFEVTTNAQVVGNSNVKRCLDGLTSLDDLESRLVEVVGADAETDAVEGDFLLGLKDLNLLNVRVIEESTGSEELQVLGSGVLDQYLYGGVASELKLNVEW